MLHISSSSDAAADAARVEQNRAIYGDAPTDGNYAEDSASSDDDDDETDTKTSKPKSSFLSRLLDPIQGLTGNRILSRSDLETTLQSFKESLMGKNVAADIAEKLCESIAISLDGQKQQSFTTIHQTVKKVSIYMACMSCHVVHQLV